MLQSLKKMMVGRLVKLFRTALHDPDVRDDLRDIATELLRDTSVCNHMKSISSEVLRDLNASLTRGRTLQYRLLWGPGFRM